MTSDDIHNEMIKKSFKQCGFTNALDGAEDDMIWEDGVEDEPFDEDGDDLLYADIQEMHESGV